MNLAWDRILPNYRKRQAVPDSLKAILEKLKTAQNCGGKLNVLGVLSVEDWQRLDNSFEQLGREEVFEHLRPVFSEWQSKYFALMRLFRLNEYTFKGVSDYLREGAERSVLCLYHDVHAWDVLAAMAVADVNLQEGYRSTFFLNWGFSPLDREREASYRVFRHLQSPEVQVGMHAGPFSSWIRYSVFHGDDAQFMNWVKDAKTVEAEIAKLSDETNELAFGKYKLKDALDGMELFLKSNLKEMQSCFSKIELVNHHGDEIGRVASLANKTLAPDLIEQLGASSSSFYNPERLSRLGLQESLANIWRLNRDILLYPEMRNKTEYFEGLNNELKKRNPVFLINHPDNFRSGAVQYNVEFVSHLDARNNFFSIPKNLFGFKKQMPVSKPEKKAIKDITNKAVSELPSSLKTDKVNEHQGPSPKPKVKGKVFPVQPVPLDKGIFLCGFARGGTTWARRVIAAHPEIFEVPGQVEFHNAKQGVTAELMQNRLQQIEVGEAGFYPHGKRFITKSPANSVVLKDILLASPKSQYIYIVRDPRDVLISYQRTGAQWTDQQSSFDAAMTRTRHYFQGYEAVKGHQSLFEFTYEDLHQNFSITTSKIFEFLGVRTTNEIIETCLLNTEFGAATGRKHEEKKSHMRKGVVGDWANHLTFADAERFKSDPFWVRMMEEYGYNWEYLTAEKLLETDIPKHIKDSGVVLSVSDANWTYPSIVTEQFSQAIEVCRRQGIEPVLGIPLSLKLKELKLIIQHLPTVHEIAFLADDDEDCAVIEKCRELMTVLDQAMDELSYRFKNLGQTVVNSSMVEQLKSLGIKQAEWKRANIYEANGSLVAAFPDQNVDLRNLLNTGVWPEQEVDIVLRPGIVSVKSPLTLGFPGQKID
ncbi:sulfotransferase domain-containing protein [Sneathiella limimaris]|uniref:sulfotransferase domain-containing protein n=1 Tax=Sneathiella limimaris TaxID=1964213 RepID=UPI00146F4FF1|nr:sulfotransferase domain-containing protein [Sneathiella limimaris]